MQTSQPVMTAIITIRDAEGNIKAEVPVTFTPEKEDPNGSDPDLSST